MPKGRVVAVGSGAFVALAALICMSPPPAGNIAMFEAEPLRPGVADPADALTFAAATKRGDSDAPRARTESWFDIHPDTLLQAAGRAPHAPRLRQAGD